MMRKLIAALLTACCLLACGEAWAIEKTLTGFYWPLDKFRYSLNQPTGKWLAPRRGGRARHLGVDMFAPVGQPARAIAEGTVHEISGSGWGRGNIAVLIKHRLKDDSWFIALYGHIIKTSILCKGSKVTAGQVIGRVGRYAGGSHLHFGVVAPGRLPVAGYGSTKKLSHNNFIDPLAFLRNGRPGHDEDGNGAAAVCLIEEERKQEDPQSQAYLAEEETGPELRPAPAKKRRFAASSGKRLQKKKTWGRKKSAVAGRKAARSRRSSKSAHKLRRPAKKKGRAAVSGDLKKKRASRRPAARRR